jgi:hypothetical protein
VLGNLIRSKPHPSGVAGQNEAILTDQANLQGHAFKILLLFP